MSERKLWPVWGNIGGPSGGQLMPSTPELPLPSARACQPDMVFGLIYPSVSRDFGGFEVTVRWLKPSPVMGVERFASFEEFQPNHVIGGGISRPLKKEDVSACRAVLPLADSLLVLQRSFAREVETSLGPGRGVGMAIPFDYRASVNGQRLDDTQLTLIRGNTPVHILEEQANTYLMLRLDSNMLGVGWPEFDEGLIVVRPDLVSLRRLQATVLDIFCWASACADPKEFFELRHSMQETLRAALDDVMVADRPARSEAFTRYRRLVSQIDEIIQLCPTERQHVEDLGASLGVSLRTLQNAVHAVAGVNLYHYLRLKRLWAARQQLTTGSSGLTIKTAARANGFWHMSEFTRTYKTAFGEAPSQTLARARRA